MEITQFAEKLLRDKGMVQEDPEVQKQLELDLVERIEDRVQAAIMRELPENSLQSFEKILDTGSDDEIQKFLKENIKDFDQKMALELASFRSFYLG